MRARRIVLTIATLLAGLTMCFGADNLNMGTWKLNDAKSKVPAGYGKNLVVKYEADGDNIKVTIDGVDGKMNPTHTEWVGKFDGKDYPVTGDSTSDARAVKEVNDRTLEFTVKKGGKVVMTGKAVVARDGKSRTLTTKGTDVNGKKVESTSVYDKQ